MDTLDSAHMRVLNSSILLKMIWRDREISRADISQRTGMSRSTVSTIVADLIKRGLVTETGTGHSNGGRRPVILTFNEDAFSILGVDMGAERIAVAITNLRGQVRHWWQVEAAVLEEPEQSLKDLLALLELGKQRALLDQKPLIGMGVALPSPVSSDEESNPMNETMHPKWKGVALQKILREHTKLPVVFGRDANLGAVAEFWWCEAKKRENLAYIHPRMGLALGLMIEGRMHGGSHGFAGDLGPLPNAGTKALAWNEAYLQRKVDLDEDGLEQVSSYLANLTSHVMALLDLDAVVFDQAFRLGGDQLIPRVSALVDQRWRWPVRREARIEACALGDRQLAIGASTLILAKALDDFSFFPPSTNSSFEWTWSQGAVLTT